MPNIDPCGEDYVEIELPKHLDGCFTHPTRIEANWFCCDHSWYLEQPPSQTVTDDGIFEWVFSYFKTMLGMSSIPDELLALGAMLIVFAFTITAFSSCCYCSNLLNAISKTAASFCDCLR